MFLRNAAGERLVLGQDVVCDASGQVGVLMGIQLAAKCCWIRLRDGAVVCANAAKVSIAAWSQISSPAKLSSAQTLIA